MARYVICFELITFKDPIIDYFTTFSHCFKHYKLSHNPDATVRLMNDIFLHLRKLDYRFVA
jgi:hypothetical protein